MNAADLCRAIDRPQSIGGAEPATGLRMGATGYDPLVHKFIVLDAWRKFWAKQPCGTIEWVSLPRMEEEAIWARFRIV